MITTPSGLQYADTVAGDGAEAEAGQHVKVHYTGWLHDPAAPQGRGRKFDSSKDRNDQFRFGLGAGQVVRGRGWRGWKDGGCRAHAKDWRWWCVGWRFSQTLSPFGRVTVLAVKR